MIPHLAPEEAARRAAAAFTVEKLADVPPGDVSAAVDRLAAAGRDGTAFLLVGTAWLLAADPAG